MENLYVGKHRALSRKVTWSFRLGYKIGWTSIKPNIKHWLWIKKLSNHCLHTGELNTAYMIGAGQNVKAQSLLFTYSTCIYFNNKTKQQHHIISTLHINNK